VEWKSLPTKTRIYGLTVPEHFHQNDSTPPAVKEVTDQNIESNTNTGTHKSKSFGPMLKIEILKIMPLTVHRQGDFSFSEGTGS
jgi:hypothetical protein